MTGTEAGTGAGTATRRGVAGISTAIRKSQSRAVMAAMMSGAGSTTRRSAGTAVRLNGNWSDFLKGTSLQC